MSAEEKHSPFPMTRWSMVLGAQQDNPEALAELCRSYWFPIYAFARRSGSSTADAEDLTQGFFLHVISKDFFKKANRNRGRLRSLLLASFKHFCSTSRRSELTQKRGGQSDIVHIDAVDAEARMALEPSHGLTPEAEFDRQWVREVLAQAKSRVRADYQEAGKLDHFLALEDQLEEGKSDRSYRDIAEERGMEEATLRYTAFKLRQRFKTAVEDVIRDTVASEEDAEQELADLGSIFSE